MVGLCGRYVCVCSVWRMQHAWAANTPGLQTRMGRRSSCLLRSVRIMYYPIATFTHPVHAIPALEHTSKCAWGGVTCTDQHGSRVESRATLLQRSGMAPPSPILLRILSARGMQRGKTSVSEDGLVNGTWGLHHHQCSSNLHVPRAPQLTS